MHPLNHLLGRFGARIMRVERPPSPQLRREYDQQLVAARDSMERGYSVIREPVFDAGDHPASYIDFECAFAAKMLARSEATTVLDIGSYRLFIAGLAASRKVTSVDVRDRKPVTSNETVVTCDAKALSLPSGSFDAVVSLCAIEHFGLGRYGDALDLQGDLKALAEMKRVLRPGGTLILSTTVTAGRGVIAFNAHRIYPLDDLRRMLSDLTIEEERFFNCGANAPCDAGSVRATVGAWDVYCVACRKLP